MEKIVKLAFGLKPLAKIKNEEGKEELCFTKPTELTDEFTKKEKLCEARNLKHVGEIEIVKPIRRVLYKPYTVSLTLEEIMLTLQEKLDAAQQKKVVAFEPINSEYAINVHLYVMEEGKRLPNVVKMQPVLYKGNIYRNYSIENPFDLSK